MAEQEVQHRTELYNLHREKFGEYLPLIRKQDVSGFIKRKPLWLTRPLGNTGLWIAILVFFGSRGALQAMRYPALVRATFKPATAPR